MIFIFPENTILFFRRKVKEAYLSQKNTWKYDMIWKYDSCIFGKDGIFFPTNMILLLSKNQILSSPEKYTYR